MLIRVKCKAEELYLRTESLDGRQHIPLTELFPARFLTDNSEFETLESLLEGSGFVIRPQEDFDSVPDDEWDNFIAQHTRFSGWKEMLGAAFCRWAARQLEFRSGSWRSGDYWGWKATWRVVTWAGR